MIFITSSSSIPEDRKVPCGSKSFGLKYRIIMFKMSFSLTRLCPRLLHTVVRKSVPCLHPKQPPIIKQQLFCSTFFDPNSTNKEESFDEFEETTTVTDLLSEVNFDEIVGDDLEKKDFLQVFISELDMLRRTQNLVAPKRLTTDQWRTLLKKRTQKARRHYLCFLYTKEKRKEVKVARSEANLKAYNEFRENRVNISRKELTTNSPVTYALGQISLFHRIYRPTVMNYYNFHLAMAAFFGPDIVVDCSYEENMTDSEIHGCARQILYMWSSNRRSPTPFNINFCNLNPGGSLMYHLTNLFHKLGKDDHFFLNLTEKSYTDFYSVKELVYLTPHCDEELEKYDGNSVYIIGAFVDEMVHKPVSLEKAKRDGLRTAKFPLDKNLNWAQGSKLLPINQCLCIMNDLKNGAEWPDALRHIATRKQSFQTFGNPKFSVDEKRAKSYIRETSRREMLWDLNLKGPSYSRNEPKPVDDDL